ncbi:hypothetical protein OG765_21055 [Streptomyces sp. NBC_00555]|uniref:hypothetical protein n=1 Tax=Streptomyces sp. NBC_00555 TaxID=2903662 RepID=UPI00225A32A1|nr:hypothetical protein [Streptomyces sp. NBC_00555]MCX5013461.1 hypothetical protein [Streptomyces sp. NBC_00555]
MSRTSAPSSSSASSSASSSVPAAAPSPAPPSLCSSTCPPARSVPSFPPLRVGRGGDRLRRALRRRRRAVSAGLAVAAAALAVGGTEAQASRGAAPPEVRASRGATPPVAVRMVSAPVRIADAATVRLLRPGDRVDVVAAERAGPPRVVAAGARVAEVPPADQGVGDGGALVVLSVPRDTARALVGAGATARLAVTLC